MLVHGCRSFPTHSQSLEADHEGVRGRSGRIIDGSAGDHYSRTYVASKEKKKARLEQIQAWFSHLLLLSDDY